MAFLGYPHAPRATAQGIHFRSTAIVQSVSGDARDVPFTTEVLDWSYGLGATERQSCPFFGNDARFTGHAPRATAQGIHFRLTAIVQSVSGDARDVAFDY